MNNVLVGNLKSKTTWVGTVITIFGVLYDNWSQVAQLIPPEHVGKAFSVFGVLMLILRNLTNDSVSDKASAGEAPIAKQGGFARLQVLGALTVACLVITACATFQTNQAAYQLAVDVAVTKFIDNSAADRKAVRMERIKNVATNVKVLASGDSAVTIDALQAAVQVQLRKLNLSATDQLLASDLVSVIAVELQRRVGQDILKPDQRVQVTMVMDWIIKAVEFVEHR